MYVPISTWKEELMIAMRSPLMMEGPKTIAGEKGTVSERSFVMVRPSLFITGIEWS
jgi:hypothetical protein